MINILNTFLALYTRYITFLIGTSQFILTMENPIIWAIIQIISDFQILSVLYIYQIIFQKLTTNLPLIIVYIAIPSNLFMKFIDNHIYPLSVLIMMLVLIHVFNIIMIYQATKHYQRLKRNQKSVENESLSGKYERLSQIYGYSDYSNLWFEISYQKRSTYIQLLIGSCIFFNIYQKIFTKIFMVYSLYVIQTQSLPEALLAVVLLILDILNYFINYHYFSLGITVHNNNFLKLRRSFIDTISQMLQIALIIFSIIAYDTIAFQSYQLTMQFLISLIYIFNLIEMWYSITFIDAYKIYTLIISSTIMLLYAILQNQAPGVMLVYLCIICPFIIKILIMINLNQINGLITEYLFPEKESPPTDNKQIQGLMGAYIRTVISQMRQKQVASLQNKSFNFFPHFLNLYSSLQLKGACIFVTQETPQNIPKRLSSFLIYIGMLVNMHAEKCVNTYCFCKGFRGEQEQSFVAQKTIRNMCVNSDLSFTQLHYYAELINRFIRNYTKSIIMQEKDKKYFDIIYLIQLLAFLASSDECIQTVMSALEVVSKINQTLSTFEAISLGVAVQFIKFNILVRYNTSVQVEEMNITFNYDQFRSIQKKCFKIYALFYTNIQAKLLLFERLEVKITYKELEEQFIKLYEINYQTQQILTTFYERTQSKTAMLCQLFFDFEICNNYANCDKLISMIKSTEPIFFENPDVFFEIEEQSTEVCYVRADLNISKANESYNGIISRGWIRDYSKNTPKYFGYAPEAFAELRNVRELLPPSTSLIHDDFIELFLLTTRPNVIRAKVPLFIKQQNGALVFTEFFADFNFKLPRGEFTIHIFLKKIKTNIERNYFWIDQFGFLEGVTINFFKQFKITDYNGEWLYKQEFKTIMPQFPKYQAILESQLKNYLDNEKEQTNTVTQEFSRTFVSVMIVHEIFAEQLKIVFPQDIVESGNREYLIDCKMSLKYAQLIGRIYKVFYIEIISAMDCHDFNQSVQQLTSLKPSSTSRMSHNKIESIASEISDFECFNLEDHELSLPEKINYSQSAVEQEEFVEMKFVQNPYLAPQNEIPSSQRMINDISNLNSIRLQQTQRQPLFYADQHEETSRKSLDQIAENKISHKISTMNNQINQKIVMDNQSQQDSTTSSKGLTKPMLKSMFYNNFATSQIMPKVLMFSYIVNLSSIFIILAFIISSYVILKQTQDKQISNLPKYSILDASDYTQNIIQYLQGNYQNAPLSSISISRLDYIINNQSAIIAQNNQSLSWITLYNLRYSFITINTTDQVKSLNYLLDTYSSYQSWLQLLNSDNKESQLQLTRSLNSQIILQIIIIFMFYVFSTVIIIFTIKQFQFLIVKLIRCNQQISYQSLFYDSEYYEYLLTQFIKNQKDNTTYLPIYEHKFDYQDKLQLLVQDKSMNNSHSTKKYILKQQQQHNSTTQRSNISLIQTPNLRQYAIIFLILLTFTLFLITYIAISLTTMSAQSEIQSEINSYYNIVNLNQLYSQLAGYNLVIYLNTNQIAQSKTFLEQFTTLYTQYNTLMNQLLNDQSKLVTAFKEFLNSNICVIKIGNCSETIDIQLGLSNMTQQISQSQFKGYQYQYYDNIVIQNIYSAFNTLINQSQLTIDMLLQDKYKQSIQLLLGIGITLLLLQIVQALFTQKWLWKRFYTVKQFVFMIPTVTLYVEDSFYKTLQFISQKEHQLVK